MNIRKSLLAGAAFAVATIPTLAQAGEVVGSVGDASQTIALRSAQVRIVELDRVTRPSAMDRSASTRYLPEAIRWKSAMSARRPGRRA